MCAGHTSPLCITLELSGFHALCSFQPHLLHAKPTVGVGWDTLMAKAWTPRALSLAGWGQQADELGSDTEPLTRALLWVCLSCSHCSWVTVSPKPLFSPWDDLFSLRNAAHFHSQTVNGGIFPPVPGWGLAVLCTLRTLGDSVRESHPSILCYP